MVPHSKMPTLTEVFDLVKRYGAEGIMLNIEIKVEAGAPEKTALREQFVQVVANEVREAGIIDQVTMQRVIDPGVDGIISDDHELLIRVAKRNGPR